MLAHSLVAAVHIVLAPASFREALAPYLAYRAASPQVDGVSFVALEDVLASTPGRDDPEKIKRYLYDRWHDGAVASCLLVGDADVMPVRYMTLDRGDPAAFNWAFYPSDLYYADLARADGSFEDWNAGVDDFHAGYWGEVHGETNKNDPINFDRIDYDPEIAVGRWPVSTPAEAAAIAAKTIAWESALAARESTPGAAPPSAAFFAVGGWVDVRSRVTALSQRLDGAANVQIFVHDDPSRAAPNTDAMKKVLHDGVDILFHTGHGQPNAWEQCLSERVVDEAMEPENREPIIFSAGCSTAEWTTLPPYQAYRDVNGADHKGTTGGEKFDSPPPPPACLQTGSHNTSSMSERLVKRPIGGAIAAIGCSTGSQPCAVTLIEGFVIACGEMAHKPPTLGEAWRRAVRHYKRAEHLDDLKPNADWYPPSIFFQAMKFELLGDPSLRLPIHVRSPSAAPQPASNPAPSQP